MRTSVTTAALTAIVLGLAACGSQPGINKAGAVRHDVTVIRLQMPDGGDTDGVYFAQDVADRSHGSLKVVIDDERYQSSVPADEAQLVPALLAGRADFAYQPARDFAAAGVPGFQALDAPFLVTTVQASEALAASPVAAALLRQLSGLGLVGIGLIPAEPRQLASTRPLIAPSAFGGVRLRINDSPETAALVTATGAHPVQGMTSNTVTHLLSSGSLGGVETSPLYVLNNDYNVPAPYLTSYAVFPKFQAIVASRRAWLALTASQRTAIRRAAADTLTRARQLPSIEEEELAEICASGIVVDEPSPGELVALARETASAIPGGEQVTGMIKMIRSDVSGTGPQLRPLPFPSQCRTAATSAQALALHRLSLPGGSEPQGATIPPGTYVSTDTVADFRAGGVIGPDSNKAITWTWHLYANGTFYQTQRPDYPDQPFGRGRYVEHGDQVTFSYEAYMAEAAETLRWSYYDGLLTFTIVQVQDVGARVMYTAHPWQRAG
jgi:TRAP-type C4-dicarboxylate transport system substrate-binding protein